MALLLHLLIELAKGLSLSADITSSIKCTVFEDNSGALLLATNQKISARTKHILVDWHFIWQAVDDQEVTVVKIDTKDQQADFLTKGLADGEEVGNCGVAGMAGGWCRTGDGVGDCGWL